MLSLANARDEDELRAWEQRVRNLLAGAGSTEREIEYVTEPKIDGLAISLVYENGVLVARRDAGRRRDRGGRDAEPADDRGDPAADPRDGERRRRWSRCAARSTCRWPTSRG